MKKLVVGVIIVLLILTGISFLVLQKIGDIMIDSLIESELTRLEDADFPQDNAAKPEESNVPDSGTPRSTMSPGQGGNTGSNRYNADAESPSNTPNSTGKPPSGGKTYGAAPAKQTTDPAPKPVSTPKPAPMPIDRIQEIKDSITPADKMTAAVLVLENLNSSDIGELQGMMSGGLTEQEKKRAKEIAYQRFSAEEIEKLKELYHKYMD